MPNRVIVKFVFIAGAFIFASCHNDVPELPDVSEIKFCKYKDKDDNDWCKSTYEIPKELCDAKGEFFDDKESCEDTL